MSIHRHGRALLAWLALMCVFGIGEARAETLADGTIARGATAALDYGLFRLYLHRPSNVITHVTLLFSDKAGWTPRQDRLSNALARQGAFVVGIDLPVYLQRMEALKDKCSYPAGHIEDVAHWIERREGLATYYNPLLVGDGAGATFAYALLAQAPAGTFEGLLTLGWDSTLRFPRSLCSGDAGAMTAAADGGFRVVPVAKLPAPWRPLLFAGDARIEGIGSLIAQAWRVAGVLWPAWASGDSAAELAAAYVRWYRSEEETVAALPDDVADLPLTDIAPAGTPKPGTPPRIAVIITGDGGWAGLDRGVADALTAQGIRVIGLSSLKFFWQRQTPEATADAIARVIAHYGKDEPDARFVLIGYSFGAGLVPVVLNRLPEAARHRVDGGVMISPDDTAVFEIHVGDWFGSTHHDEALPLAPELTANKVPLLCVHGKDEDDSFCLKAPQRGLTLAQLPGGHHYNGDYPALGQVIVDHLPATTAPSRAP